MPREMKWIDAVIIVLKSEGQPLSYTEIAKRIVDRELRRRVGRDAPSTANSMIHDYIKRKGEQSLIYRAYPGIYGLKLEVELEGEILT